MIDPFLLIGPIDTDVDEIKNIIAIEKYEIWDKKSAGRFTENEPLIINGVAVYLASQYLSNGLENVKLGWFHESGVIIYKGQLVFTIEDFNLTSTAEIIDSRFRKAYQYCQEEIAKLKENIIIESFTPPLGPQIAIPKKYISKSGNLNNETRLVTDLINPLFKAKYDKILQILSEKNPLAEVVNKLPKAKGNELLSHKNELKNFQNKLVYRIENEKIFVDREYIRLNSFLVYLFAYMITMRWMNRAENYATTCQIIGNTIFNKDNENDRILLDRAQLNSAVKKLEATRQTDESNSYLKFIDLIINNV